MPISNFAITKRVQYHETDAMKIAHHACYVKWMEEARTEFFRNIGFIWSDIERTSGIMIPVLFQSVEYKNFLVFDEKFRIECVLEKFNGVKMDFCYKFTSADGNSVKALGSTKHGFIDSSYKPLAIQRYSPELYGKLLSAFDSDE